MKRLFDIILSVFGLVIISPIFIVISFLIVLTSKGPVFYIQERIGRNSKPFKLFKFRSMRVGSDKKGLLTLGDNDSRVTKVGYFIRKSKIDELPQLINVLLGDMSFVGPRPEVEKYGSLYDDNQKQILKVRPGITDLASIKYRDEAEMLNKQEDPESYYIKVIMPDKVNINLDYIKKANFFSDIKVIFLTFF